MSDLSDYPWIFPPSGFIPYDRNGSIAIASGTVGQVVETVNLEVGMEGWNVYAGIELSSYGTPVAPAFFQLLQSGQIIRDYGRVQVPLGAPNTPAKLYIKLYAGQPLTLAVTNQTGIVVAARWRLYGWYYSPR